MRNLTPILKDPLIQFLIIGTLIFVLYSFSRTAEQTRMDERITIDPPTQEWIHGNFTKQFRRLPTRTEMDALVKAHIESEVKYRHALAMDLDNQDTIIQRRMMQKFDFLFGNAAADALPEESRLRDWYQANPDEFLEPATITFTHLYFSPDKRQSPEQDAATALETLQNNHKPESDTFPFEVHFDKATPAEVRNVLGPEFTQAVFETPVKSWSGPYKSGLGFHLVHVTKNTKPEILPLDQVHDAVLQRWREAESERILTDLVAELTAQFEININETALEQLDYMQEDVGERP